jgi:Starch-binding associating with outer membrane
MKTKITIALLMMGMVIMSCKKNIENLNNDIKNPSDVPPGSLFAAGVKNLIDNITTPNVNSGIFRLLSQQWTETTYTDESNYDLNTRNIPQNFWNGMYTGVLKGFYEAAKLVPLQDKTYVTEGTIKNQSAILEIMNVYTYSILVDTYGDIPYSEALNIDDVTPKYDDAKTIYDDLLTRLDAAIANLDNTQPGFGASDILLGDDIDWWKTFANSLKLRLGITIADADAAKAKTVVESAVTGGVISSNDQNVVFNYLAAPPNTNPVWVNLVQSGRKDFVAANTLVDQMKDLNDPRMSLYFTEDANADFNGGKYGASNNYATYSKPAERITNPDFPAVLIDYAEVEFLLAEAKERGFMVPGTAAGHYSNAITASILSWGGTEEQVTEYIAQPAVSYATAAGNYKQKIGTQKWIALYNRGFEAWTEWRRLDYPQLEAPVDALSDIPVRFTYPVQEQNLNVGNYSAASTAIGGDDVTTKIFWDKF